LSPEGIRVCPATRRLKNFRASAVHIDRLTGELSRAELNRGDKAPAFSLPDQDGKQVALSAHRGWKRLFFFFPKADTPGCATQACSIRDAMPELKSLGDRRRGLLLASVLAAAYAFLYAALQSEDYALLIGSLGLFVILAGVMILTRKVDWYRPGVRGR